MYTFQLRKQTLKKDSPIQLFVSVSHLPTFDASDKRASREIDTLATFKENASIPFKSLLASEDIEP